MDTKAYTRNNYLDWLRVLGILLVFIYHTTRFYNVEDWVVKNAIWYPSVEVWNKFATTFMMPLMFVLSGAALFYALRKGGFGRFLKDKTLRLLVPLLVGDLTASSLQAYLNAASHHLFNGSYLQFLPSYYHLDRIDWQGSHLWYLLVLFNCGVVLYPLLRWLKAGGSDFLSKLGGALSKRGVVYVLALPLLLPYLVFPSGSPLRYQQGGWPYLAYLWFILLGFLVVSNARLQDRIRQMRWISLAAGLALVVGFIILSNQIPLSAGMTPAFLLKQTMRSFGGWLIVLAILGLGMQYLTVRTPRLDYASEAVLPFYILHQTVLVTVGYFVLSWALPDVLEGVTIAVISFALIMVIYEYLVRRWNVVRFLFGMKRLPLRPAEEAIHPQLGGPARAG